jgi:hypothetical protein
VQTEADVYSIRMDVARVFRRRLSLVPTLEW